MYKILNHTSDLEVRIESENFEGLVHDSIEAITEYVSENTKSAGEKIMKFQGSEEDVLMKALEETVYFQSAEGFFADKIGVSWNGSVLKVALEGGKAGTKGEIKAVTWHEFKVEKMQKGWKAHFVCDL